MAEQSDLNQLRLELRSGKLNRRQFIQRALAAGVTLSALPAFLAACSGSQPPAQPQQSQSGAAQPTAAAGAAAAPAASAGQPKKGGTLNIVRPTDAVSLDPHIDTTAAGGWVSSNMFETLVKLDYDMKPKPLLAEKWEQVAPDRWRFFLRKGVKFHDGTDFKADSVKYSLQRAKSPQSKAASALVALKSAEIQDDYTVDIVTDGPLGPFLYTMANWYGVMAVSQAADQKYGKEFGRNPVGTGPFKFTEWKTNTSITIERWDGYWGDKALLDKVVYKTVPEESARMLAIQTGEADIAMMPAVSQLADFRKDSKYVVNEVPGVFVIFFGMNNGTGPLSDVRVRQAVNLAFDRKPVVDNVLEGAATPATGFVAPGVFGYKDISSSWAYNPDKAASLMQEAGYTKGSDGFWAKGGQPIVLKHVTPQGRYLKDAEVTQAFQGAMRQFGIQVDVQVAEWGAVFTKWLANGLDTDMNTLGWATVTADSDYTFSSLLASTAQAPKGFNLFKYSDPKVDELGKQAGKETDEAKRKELYGQLWDAVAADYPFVPVYSNKEIAISTSAVKGFKLHSLQYLVWMNTTWLDK